MEKKDVKSKISDHYEDSMKEWFDDEKAGFELINILGKLFYDKNVELIFLRN